MTLQVCVVLSPSQCTVLSQCRSDSQSRTLVGPEQQCLTDSMSTASQKARNKEEDNTGVDVALHTIWPWQGSSIPGEYGRPIVPE